MYKDNIIAHAYAGMNNADNVGYMGTAGDAEVFVIGTGLEYLF